MKSAGHHSSNSFCCLGKCRVAQEATALSNQTSKTSGDRFILPPHGQSIRTLSTSGLWSSGTFWPLLSSSSAAVPMTSIFPHAEQVQMGRGIPQYLCREMHQSLALEIQSANLAEPAQSGYHFTLPTSSSILFRRSEIRRNHCRVAMKMMGVLHLQQCPYLWANLPWASNRPRSARSRIISPSASFTYLPSYLGPASSV